MKHRRPPLPSFYNTAEKGRCRYCGQMIFKPSGEINTRAHWHPLCVIAYKKIYWPNETRKAVRKRDRGCCANCNRVSKDWHVDHIQPLIESQGRIEFWQMANLQTLCHQCHRDKTSREATARAQKRKS